MRPIIYYVTAHGYGHSVRTCDIVRKLHEIDPEIPVILRTVVDDNFFRSRLKPNNYSLSPASFDLGLLQKDCIRADIPATLEQLESFLQRREELTEGEAVWLKEKNAGLIIADIPAIPIAAAKRTGIHATAIANFSWDWIYSEFITRDHRWQRIVDTFATDYAKTDILLRLPFSGPMKAFPRQCDVGLLSVPGTNQRAAIAKRTGADSAKKWILIAFSKLEWEKDAPAKIAALRDYEFITLFPFHRKQSNIHHITHDIIAFDDLVASVDGVLSKPGYGIVSDCIANSTPLAHVERTDFLEYAVLVQNIKRYLKNTRLTMEELYSGNIRTAIDSLWDQPEPPDTMPCGGARQAIKHILRLYTR